MQSDCRLGMSIQRLIVNTSTPRTTDALTVTGRNPRNDTSDNLRAVTNRRQSRG
jgi:hypothetical protein